MRATQEAMMVRVGIIGLGGMGNMHFGVYEKNKDAQVVALADTDKEKLKAGSSAKQINIGKGGATIDPKRHRLYDDPDKLIADKDVDLVDICLPTFLHPQYIIKALEAGKHVLCEKPMALTPEECARVLAAAKGKKTQLMIAQCIRFWPEYVYLKETVDSGRLGKVRTAHFWRGGSIPEWSWQGWLKDHKRSGGAILDLHVHDVDFVHYLLGRPKAVCSTGAKGPSGGYDAVETVYVYEEKMAVHSGANMGLPPEFGFEMRYAVSFEKGCLLYSTRNSPTLTEVTDEGRSHPQVRRSDGYHEEIAYFLKCVANNEAPAVCTPESAAFSITLEAAEMKSVETGKMVEL
jgi:predicted dehydrogenase